jgi:hypothetical protein
MVSSWAYFFLTCHLLSLSDGMLIVPAVYLFFFHITHRMKICQSSEQISVSVVETESVFCELGIELWTVI